MSGMRYLTGGASLELDPGICVGCGVCELVCPHSVFTNTGGVAELRDRDACMECGACALNCEAGAIAVTSGVGCAAAVINAALGRTDGCCSTES